MSDRAKRTIYEHVARGFREALKGRDAGERRIGAELKFPVVNADGSAADLPTVVAMWESLIERGWVPVMDDHTGNLIGAEKPGEQNNTVASCETGYCKSEFSLAHVADLFDLHAQTEALRKELEPFAEEHGVRFLAYGIHPVTRPGKHLLMKRGRTSVWDKVFGANRILPPEDGDDMNLFTVNAASHVHVSVSEDEAVKAVNVLNGFAPAQLALTAHSNVWKGQLDPDHKCVAEMFWDWWIPDADRVGVPPRAFADLKDYVDLVASLRPVYVKRAGKPIVLEAYDSFAEYFAQSRAVGRDTEGREISFVPERADIDLHSTCYWFNARLSRYYTVENRANDQQPPDALVGISALTLGLVSALDEAWEELDGIDWQTIRRARPAACREALAASVDGLDLADFADRMLSVAKLGLHRRGLGEGRFLQPFFDRLADRRCPADQVAEIFRQGGMAALLDARTL